MILTVSNTELEQLKQTQFDKITNEDCIADFLKVFTPNDFVDLYKTQQFEIKIALVEHLSSYEFSEVVIEIYRRSYFTENKFLLGCLREQIYANLLFLRAKNNKTEKHISALNKLEQFINLEQKLKELTNTGQ